MSKTMHAIEISQPGGPGVLRMTDRPMPQAGPGQVVIKVGDERGQGQAPGAAALDPIEQSRQLAVQAEFEQGRSRQSLAEFGARRAAQGEIERLVLLEGRLHFDFVEHGRLPGAAGMTQGQAATPGLARGIATLHAAGRGPG